MIVYIVFEPMPANIYPGEATTCVDIALATTDRTTAAIAVDVEPGRFLRTVELEGDVQQQKLVDAQAARIIDQRSLLRRVQRVASRKDIGNLLLNDIVNELTRSLP